MHCAQLRAARFDCQNVMRTTRNIDRDTDEKIDGLTYGKTYTQISSTGPQWGPPDPSMGINALQRWTPTLEINIYTFTVWGYIYIYIYGGG